VAKAGDNSNSASLFMGTKFLGTSSKERWSVGRLSLRRGNEHFSKRTEHAGIV
jgi:hypothetical protein